MKKLVGTLLLSGALVLGGCAAGGGQKAETPAETETSTKTDTTETKTETAETKTDTTDTKTDTTEVEVDPAEVKNGKAEFHGWVPEAVEYCKEHAREKGVLIEVTGLISKGYTEETTSTITLVDPEKAYGSDEEDAPDISELGKEVELNPGDNRVEVFYAEPVETTRWSHLETVRGVAMLDPTEENTVIIRGAINIE